MPVYDTATLTFITYHILWDMHRHCMAKISGNWGSPRTPSLVGRLQVKRYDVMDVLCCDGMEYNVV